MCQQESRKIAEEEETLKGLADHALVMWNKVESRVLTCNLSSFSQNASVQKLVHNSISGYLWPFDGKHWKTYENMLIPLKTLENWGVFWSLRPESTGLSKLQALTDALWLQAIRDSPAKGWGFQSMGVPPNHSFSTFSSVNHEKWNRAGYPQSWKPPDGSECWKWSNQPAITSYRFCWS